jgi:Protein of unknown function (DUF1552)
MPPPPPHRPLGRRRFLRGAAGAALALPFLDLDGDRPARAASFPKRLVIVFTPNGQPKPTFACSGGETDFVLSPILAPLAAHRDDLVIVEGVDMESSYHGTGEGMHINGIGHLLTATEMVDTGFGDYWGGGISLDQRLAAEIGSSTKLPSLELACDLGEPSVRTHLSYLGAAQPVPAEPDPLKVYDRLFGSASPDRIARRKSVLDAVGGDFKDLEAELGKDDRQRVDAHFQAVRSIESRLDIAPACAAVRPRVQGEPSMPVTGHLQMDLLVRALACDLTRVVTLMWSPSTSQAVFSWLAISESHHNISHAVASDATAAFQLLEINRWYALEFAHLLDAMAAVPEGDGTLLDHSLVIWVNELSDGQIHSRRDLPIVIAGRAGGALKTGRKLSYGGAMMGDNHGCLLVSLAHAMDVPLKTFGNPAYCSGPLPGLL